VGLRSIQNIRTENGEGNDLLFWVAVIAGCVVWLVVAIGVIAFA
jgi:hypothetical protein